jgi:hypothetical protein
MVSLNSDTGNHRRSYVANIDVTDRQSVEVFSGPAKKLYTMTEVLSSDISGGDEKSSANGADEVRWAD